MQITPDPEFTQYLLDKVIDGYMHRNPRKGKWHVSDLLFPRYAVLSRMVGHKPTRTDVGFFLTGEAYHAYIQKVLGKENAEVKGEAVNIVASADFFNGEDLIEFKTSRKWTVPNEPDPLYIKQARYYAVIFGQFKARIVVLLPTAGRKWDGSQSSTVELVSWTVLFSQEELDSTYSEMQELGTSMGEALASGDLSKLPLCPEWKYGTIVKVGKEYQVEVRCPYATTCRCAEESLAIECQRKNDARRVK
jgi:hypothetical protein